MMTKIAALAISAPILVDGRRVNDIVSNLGETAAHHMIGIALEQLVMAIGDLDDAVQTHDPQIICRQTDLVSRLAWQIGLLSLAGVAIDMGDCAQNDDPIGLAATCARLHRVAGASMTKIWDQPDP